MRAYLLTVLVTALAAVLAVALVVALGMRQGLVDFVAADLYRFQRAKLEAAAAPALVFVGDSALGNAIDARAWTQATGATALNLALTGSFGYGAAVNFVARALERGIARRVVVMFSADALTRPVSEEGFVLTADRPGALLEVSPVAVLKAWVDLDAAASVLRRLAGAGGTQPENFAARDYPAQRDMPRERSASFRAAFDALELRAADIVPEHRRFLGMLAAACRRAGIECVYAHGPVADSVCRNSAAYFAAARELIEASGLHVVAGTPVCLPVGELGDTFDHARPELRERVTRQYVDLLGRRGNAKRQGRKMAEEAGVEPT